MSRNNPSNIRTEYPFILYIFFVIIYLGIQMFQGFSHLDIGFYMSGYQHFNEEPYVSYFLGQWLLSFQLTLFLCDLFSINSYLGLRMLHLVFVVLSQTVIYLYLKQYINRRIIIFGLLLATFAHFGSYTEINYNDYSVGLLTLAVMAYHHGFANNSAKAILLSGLFVGTAFFFRIVNITFIGIPFLAWIVSYKYTSRLKTSHQFAAFFAGTAIACAVVTIILYATGMLEVFTMNLQDIFTRGHDPQDPHGVKTIIICLYDLYKGQIQGFSVIALLIFLIAVSYFNLHGIKRNIMTAVMALLIIPNIYLWESPSNITVGICLSASAFLFIKPESESKTASLYLLSLFIPVVFPVGSNAGADFYGKDMCFMTLPAALGIIYEGIGKLKAEYRKATYPAMRIGYVFICIAMIYTNIHRPMMEESARRECRYTINSPLTKHIYTSKENADINNYIIQKVKPLVPDNSYMICDFSIPIISLLDCKPFAVYSTVFTSDMMNRRYIDVAYRYSGQLPYLLTDTENRNEKDRFVEECLSQIKPYRTIWTDGRFALKAPAVRTHINHTKH